MKIENYCLFLLTVAFCVSCNGLRRPDMPLDPVCLDGRGDRLDELLQRGGDINEVDANGNRPIYHCICRRYFDIAVELYKRGATLNYKNARGLTAIEDMDIYCKGSYPLFLERLEKMKLTSTSQGQDHVALPPN